MRILHCSFLWAALLFVPAAAAQEVSLIGVIGAEGSGQRAAILSLKGGEPKTVKVGQTWKGITVLAVEQERATLEIGGRKLVLARGQHSSAAGGSDRKSAILPSDASGHFFVHGAINGQPARMLLDTGATMVSMPASEARRLGIDYRKGPSSVTHTAAGPVPAWQVRLETVRVGEIELAGVQGLVIEQGLDIVLLGMSFLNRVEMRRAGETMTLIRRF